MLRYTVMSKSVDDGGINCFTTVLNLPISKKNKHVIIYVISSAIITFKFCIYTFYVCIERGCRSI